MNGIYFNIIKNKYPKRNSKFVYKREFDNFIKHNCLLIMFKNSKFKTFFCLKEFLNNSKSQNIQFE